MEGGTGGRGIRVAGGPFVVRDGIQKCVRVCAGSLISWGKDIYIILILQIFVKIFFKKKKKRAKYTEDKILKIINRAAGIPDMEVPAVFQNLESVWI